MVLEVKVTISFLVESYRSSQGDKDSWAIIARYQAWNVFESPLNFGRSNFESETPVVNLENVSVSSDNIWHWKSREELDDMVQEEIDKGFPIEWAGGALGWPEDGCDGVDEETGIVTLERFVW